MIYYKVLTMPYARRYKKRPKRRRRYKRSKAVIRKSPVPLRFYTKLRYVGQIALNPTASVADALAVHGNGLYQPISGGHQPRGFDQLMSLYDHFVCVGSKIRVTYQPTDSTNSTVGISIRDSATLSTSFSDYMEGGNVRSRALGESGSTPTVITMSTSPRKFLGRSKVLSDPELKGSAAANPTEGFYYHLFADASDGSSDPGQIDCVFIIDYSVVFIEPKVPTQS